MIERTDKADHIALTTPIGCVLHHTDIGRAGLQQSGIGLLQVGDVLGHIVGHKSPSALDRRSALPFHLQGHEVQRLPRQSSPGGDSELVIRRLDDAELCARDGKRTVDRCLDLHLGRIARNFGSAVGLPKVRE